MTDEKKLFKRAETPHKNALKKRSMSRLIALQLLHQSAQSGGAVLLPEDLLWSQVITDLKEEGIEGDDAYVEKLLQIFRQTALTHFDPLVGKSLESPWTLERLEPLLLQILRLGVAELLHIKEADPKLIINEYVTLSYKFFEQKQAALVHAVLARAKANADEVLS